jgi:hypothetical protein
VLLMGRLTLNVFLSFAQFEREVIASETNSREAAKVRMIFERFLKGATCTSTPAGRLSLAR